MSVFCEKNIFCEVYHYEWKSEDEKKITSSQFLIDQSFINFTNFYRKFIKNFFCIAAELMNMLKSSEDILKKKLILQISEFLISETANFFCKLIWIFTTAFFLKHFDSEKEIWVETDVSEFIILNIFTQKHDN